MHKTKIVFVISVFAAGLLSAVLYKHTTVFADILITDPMQIVTKRTSKIFPTTAMRADNWNRFIQRNLWEFEYGAYGPTSARNQRYQDWWDSPAADDFGDNPKGVGACRYHFNYPTPGFLTLNRIYQLNGQPCPVDIYGSGSRNVTGTIWRRDEYLTQAKQTGLTVEFAVQIPSVLLQVQRDAFVVEFVGPDNSFAVYLSPDCIKIGHARKPDTRTCSDVGAYYHKAKPIDATQMNTYRIVMPPNDNSISVYVNGSSTPYITAPIGIYPQIRPYLPGQPVGVNNTDHEFPVILFGDNFRDPDNTVVAANRDWSAVYTMDFIRYSRGAFVGNTPPTIPNQTSGPFRKRVPPVLPINRPVTEPGFEFTTPLPTDPDPLKLRQFRGNPAHYVYGSMQNGVFVASSSTSTTTGILEINGISDTYIYRTLPYRGGTIFGNDNWTIELRAKVMPDTSYRGFALSFSDRIGSITFTLSPDQVDLQLGGKWLGYAEPVVMDTTNQFHTYRLVRKVNDPYVYLFIDDIPTPAIADFKMSGTQFNRSNIENELGIGWITQNLPTAYYEIGDGRVIPVADGKQHLLLDYIRWDNQAPLATSTTP